MLYVLCLVHAICLRTILIAVPSMERLPAWPTFLFQITELVEQLVMTRVFSAFSLSQRTKRLWMFQEMGTRWR